MKRRNIFFALAFILAIGSAFTTKPAIRSPKVLYPGYTKSTSCAQVLTCDNVPNYFCTVAFTNEQAYKDQGTCIIPLKRSTP